MTFNTTKPNQIKENHSQRNSIFFDFSVENIINNSDKEIEGLKSFLEFRSKINSKSKALKFHRGTINAIVARQGAGKSTLPFNLAVDFIKQGKQVLFLTLEETREVVSNKMLALMAYKLGYELPKKLPEDMETMNEYIQWQAKATKRGQFDGLPSLIDQSIKDLKTGLRVAFVEPSLAKIVNLILEEHEQSPFDIVFIDYFQLLEGEASQNSWDSSLVNAGVLKELAVTNNMIIVTGSQANRASVQGANKNIGTESISGGDGLANVCNVIISIEREEDKTTHEPLDTSIIKIIKDRDSQLGINSTIKVTMIDNQIKIPIPSTGVELIKIRK